MRVFKEDGALAAALQHQVGNLCIAPQGAAVVAVHPGFVRRPAFAPGQLVEFLPCGARAHPALKAREQVKVLRHKIQHGGLHGIVRNQRHGLVFKVMKAIGIAVARQACVHALHLHPVARRGHGRDKGLAVNHALALQSQCFREDGGWIDRVGQINRPIQRAPLAHAHHLSHQLHQPAFAAIGVAHQVAVAVHHVGGGNRIVGAAHSVQAQVQLAHAGFTGAQQRKQRGIFGLVVESVRSKA